MNVAILHYHLNRGGVTSVIANHLRALDCVVRPGDSVRAAILFGGRSEGWNDRLAGELPNIDLSLHVVPELDYDSDEISRAGELADRLDLMLARIGFSPSGTILHAHNHALGKNVSFPGALAELAARGFPLLLQIHDFAEDVRPQNYRRLIDALSSDDPSNLPAVLYPQAPHIHYAVLNGRDAGILKRAGVADSRIHPLPNPVSEFGTLPPRAQARDRLFRSRGIGPRQKFVLSPMRCIRRKNIGEVLLWAALHAGDATFGLTLPPLNPVEQPSYCRWKELTQSLNLPCVFELGAPESETSFGENLSAADAILTTSVAEGFGLVFLESWLAGRPLAGRNLPEITSDFTAAGLNLDTLKSQVRVPVEGVIAGEFPGRFAAAFHRSLEAYGRRHPAIHELLFQADALIEEGHVDFSRLDAALQREVIQRASADGQFRERLLECNEWIRDSLTLDADRASTMISHNAQVVRQKFSLTGCGRRLRDYYAAVREQPSNGRFEELSSGGVILDEFLCAARFHPIRIEE